MSANDMTYTIFKSNKISFETREYDYRYINSKQKINAGDLLLIEHCYVSKDIKMIFALIKYNAELFDNLYPRTKKWEESIIYDNSESIDNLVCEKAQKNIFGGEYYTLNLDISKFNHSSAPNAIVKYLNIDNDSGVPIYISYITAIKPIDIGEEITIWYGNSYFRENTDIDLNFNIDSNLINNIASQYLKKNKCKQITFNHLRAEYGLYYHNDLPITSKRLLDYFKNILKKECSVENINEWCNKLAVKFNNKFKYI